MWPWLFGERAVVKKILGVADIAAMFGVGRVRHANVGDWRVGGVGPQHLVAGAD
jgi:hypothetical protein